MKALLIADDDIVIEKIKASLTDEGYDVITYRWLIKAMDNVEEIAPEVIVISASSYPRHWKTLVQFVQSGIGGVIPKVVLYAEREFNDDDLRKSEALHITGIFNSLDAEGLSELSDILSNIKGKDFSLIFTNPKTGAFITGNISKYENNIISFNPDCPELLSPLVESAQIPQATFKNKKSIKYIQVKILSKTIDNKRLELQVI